MATPLYTMTAPVFLRAFRQLSHILDKAVEFADEQGMPQQALLDARLIDDMHPLPYQVQRASDTAKGAMVRLGRIDNVAMADEEQSFADLQERIARTVTFIESVPAQAVDGRDDAEVTLKTPNRTMVFTGRDYVLQFVLPNFFFHVTTSYAILRSRGVPIGKMDYLGGA